MTDLDRFISVTKENEMFINFTAALIGVAQLLAAFPAAAFPGQVKSPGGTPVAGPRAKIDLVSVQTSAQGEVSSVTMADWQTPDGERIELAGDSGPDSMFLPTGKNYIVFLISTPSLRSMGEQRQSLYREASSLRRYLPDVGPLQGQKQLAPLDFLGYRCAVRVGTLMVNGSLHRVQIWEAPINGRMETLRESSQGDDGSVSLVEAVRVQPSAQHEAIIKVPGGLVETTLYRVP
jgi:hypothetical protein